MYIISFVFVFWYLPLESAAELIGKSGGVQDVLAALRLFPNDVELATSACGALWSLAVNGTLF